MMAYCTSRRWGLSLALAIGLAVFGFSATQSSAEDGANVRPPANAVGSGAPAGAPPVDFDTQLWKKARQGVQGQVTIPDAKAGVLVQANGEGWRQLHTGPLPRYGAYAMGAMLALLAVFFLIRGRIRVEHGLAGRTITRFSHLERTGHWLLAVSFIILGLTGLNVLYGREVLLPLIGKEAFAQIAMTGKWLHNYVAFAFMAGLLLTFLVWVGNNFPNRHDVVWLLRGGGMFSKGVHPPAKKFNAGQKILFWLIMLGGLSISLSGISLLFPFETGMFSKTFAILNNVGFNLPTNLTAVEEMQYAATWHSIIAIFLVCVIFAHIYIGTLGMEGAFAAMGSGEVDVNWAKEHHNLWAEEELSSTREAAGARLHPAE